MKLNRSFIEDRMTIGIALALCLTSSPAQQPGAPQTQRRPADQAVNLTVTNPDSVGFSGERLERLHSLMQQTVDQKQIAGIVTILARHGKVVDYRSYGVRDLASGVHMKKDAIFRDFSMTKPVTGVALMILYEEGKWLPSDPIAKYIPEFANLKVFNGVDAEGKMILVDPDHAPTMSELMTHTAGFSYGIGTTPADAMYKDLKVRQSRNLQEFIEKIAKIPLLYQPGKGWIYSLSMDIEGYIVERLSGQSLPQFMDDRIFKPLGMRDSGFFVAQSKRDRFASLYENGSDGKLIPDSTNGGGFGDYSTPPTMPSGGGGLVSTAEDYYRFAQMLGYGGKLNGARILAPSTIHLMTSNHLPAFLLTGEYKIGLQVLRPGFGYGYNVAAVFDPAEADLPEGKDTFLWDGAAGTWFWVDPTNDIVFVGMIQRMRGGNPNVEYLSHSLVYQALVDPAK